MGYWEEMKRRKRQEKEKPVCGGKDVALYSRLLTCIWRLPITKPKLNFPLSAKQIDKRYSSIGRVVHPTHAPPHGTLRLADLSHGLILHS